MATRFFTPGIGWRGGSCCCCGAGGIVNGNLSESRAPEFSSRKRCSANVWCLCHLNPAVWDTTAAIGLFVQALPQSKASLPLAVAFFVFFAAAARAGIIAADFCCGANRLRRLGLA